MPQSLVQIYVHFVYSTKDRKAFFNDKEFRDRTHRYLAGICRNLKSPALIVGGAGDHVHILCRSGRNIEVADLIRDLKPFDFPSGFHATTEYTQGGPKPPPLKYVHNCKSELQEDKLRI